MNFQDAKEPTVLLTPEQRVALQKFQNQVAQWPQTRWAQLFFGVTSLLTAVLLLSALFNLSQAIDRNNALFAQKIELLAKHGSGKDLSRELGEATVSVAVALALRATLGMLSGLFGAYEIMTALRYWRGRPSHVALAAVIAKEFGIVGDRATVRTNTVRPSLSHAQLRFRALLIIVIAVCAGAYLLWKGDSLPLWQSLLLLVVVLSAAASYLWTRYLMSFYRQGTDGARRA